MDAVVGDFTHGNTSFLVMNPNVRFVLAIDVIVCTVGVEMDLRTSVCMSPTVLEPVVLWSGLIFVMMIALSSKLFKHRTLVSFRLLTSIYDNNQHWKFNHVLRNNDNWP